MKHAIFNIMDVPPKYDELGNRKPSTLEIALDRLRLKGAKVLNFWRQGKGWQIKVMTPKESQ